MSDISQWSDSAGGNTAAPPDGWPEGQLPSTVNNCARENMAALRRWYEDAEWVDWGHTPTQASTSSFTVSGDYTTVYHAGRRVKAYDASIFYGTISSVTYSTNTRVSLTLDSGNLTASLTAVGVSILSFTNQSMPVSSATAAYARSAGFAATATNATRATSASAALNASFATRAQSASAALNASFATRAQSASAAGTLQGFVPSQFLQLSSTSTATVKQFFGKGLEVSGTSTFNSKVVFKQAIQFDSLNVSGTSTFASKLVASGGVETNNVTLKEKIIEIGGWNMDREEAALITHGLPSGDVRAISVIVRDDLNQFYPLDRGLSAGDTTRQAYIEGLAAVPFLSLRRLTGGYFDGTLFDQTATASGTYNRGFVLMTYKV